MSEICSVFGLGKLGLTLLSCLAAAGHRVIGVDVDQDRVRAINDDSIVTHEPFVLERLKKGRPFLSATTTAESAVRATDLSIILVPTPSNSSGGFSLQYVLDALDMIGKALRTKKGLHVVSVMSSVFPGSSESRIIPYLEQAFGRKIGEDLGYCYNPLFIVLGDVVRGSCDFIGLFMRLDLT